MCLHSLKKFLHCLFKILRNQNVADGQTDGKTDGRENSIPTPHKHSLQGIIRSNFMKTLIFLMNLRIL